MSDSHASVSLPRAHVVVDASGLLCPGPIVELAKAIKGAEVGQIVEVVATDTGFLVDGPAWAAQTKHELVGAHSADGRHRFWFRKVHP